jgi:hypothetical protein
MGSTQGQQEVQRFNLRNYKVPANGCKNNKILIKIEEVRTMTPRSTHGDRGSINVQFFEVQLSHEVLENDKII